jgi:hypothetical protein
VWWCLESGVASEKKRRGEELERRGRREATELLDCTAGSCVWDKEISIEAEM